MRNILYIVPSDFDSLKKKGVEGMILDRDEGGFFDNVLTLHPFTKENRVIELRKNNKIIEYGWKSKFQFLNTFIATKIFGTITILVKLFFIFPFIIKKEKISIIRATDPYYMGLLGFYYSKLFKIPFVVSIHSDYDKRFILDGAKGSFVIFKSRILAKKLEQFIYNHANKILPIREYMKLNIVSEFNISSNKVTVFPHGIDFDIFDTTKYMNIYQKFNIEKDIKILSFIGRLSKENYIYDLIDIVLKLKAIRKDFIILVLGNGNEYANMQHLINEKKITQYIKLVGFQDRNTVINTRKQNYVSLCLMGGFSLIEACAGARPVISYDIEWHYELVKNNKTGYLVEEGDIDKVVDKIIYLMDCEEKAKLLGHNARALAYKNHNMNKTTEVKQKMYKKVLDEQ